MQPSAPTWTSTRLWASGSASSASIAISTGAPSGSAASRCSSAPHNGSSRATLFVGYVPPGRAPWHFHLYDEIVFIPNGPGRLHRASTEEPEPLEAGAAFRLRPREVHIVENASSDRELTVLGLFTPAGSPSAAYVVAR